MLFRFFTLQILLLFPCITQAQDYTSYYTGNPNDTVTIPKGGICLMGGATEDDRAMKWFLQRANGGDVLVLRTSGSDGYNSYLYAGLGISVNSVETIVCHNANTGSNTYVLQKIQQAEAIWFAGGDQWTYINFWRNTPVMDALNQAIKQRKVVMGGTSAGMAILGDYYFSAQAGTVTSANALSNPYNSQVTVDSTSFIQHTPLVDVITDTHFDNPDRRGRLITFLARMYTDYGVQGKAIACDEYTAVCIDTVGMARVFGGFPAYDDNAYFLQVNCELPVSTPETCAAGSPLTWNRGGQAVKVYQIKGDTLGGNTFDISQWKSGTGGSWHVWSVLSGTLNTAGSTPIQCFPLSISAQAVHTKLHLFPNPASDQLFLRIPELSRSEWQVNIYNSIGQSVPVFVFPDGDKLSVQISHLNPGFYCLELVQLNQTRYVASFVRN